MRCSTDIEWNRQPLATLHRSHGVVYSTLMSNKRKSSDRVFCRLVRHSGQLFSVQHRREGVSGILKTPFTSILSRTCLMNFRLTVQAIMCSVIKTLLLWQAVHLTTNVKAMSPQFPAVGHPQSQASNLRLAQLLFFHQFVSSVVRQENA